MLVELRVYQKRLDEAAQKKVVQRRQTDMMQRGVIKKS